MPLRIVFLGSDPIALPLLDWLAGQGGSIGRVVAIATQPDRPAGRGQAVQPNAIKLWAQGHAVPVHQPVKLGAPDLEWLAAQESDLALVMAYGQILGESLIATPRLGTFNLHASLLPRYRGASPIQTALASGERETGVSFMRIVRKLDAGPVADREIVPLDRLDTAAEVEARIAAACIPLLARALPGIGAGAVFADQDPALATYCRRLVKEDGFLDFGAPAAVLAARVNGLHPWPSCTVDLAGQTLKFGLADVAAADGPGGTPGSVLGADPEGLLVATGTGVVRFRRIQRPGGRMLPAAEFLRGFPIPAGTRLPSRPMPALVGPAPFKT
jgi:methionyl-tRNA formyltransferase